MQVFVCLKCVHNHLLQRTIYMESEWMLIKSKHWSSLKNEIYCSPVTAIFIDIPDFFCWYLATSLTAAQNPTFPGVWGFHDRRSTWRVFNSCEVMKNDNSSKRHKPVCELRHAQQPMQSKAQIPAQHVPHFPRNTDTAAQSTDDTWQQLTAYPGHSETTSI